MASALEIRSQDRVHAWTVHPSEPVWRLLMAMLPARQAINARAAEILPKPLKLGFTIFPDMAHGEMTWNTREDLTGRAPG
jgi:hypothetical protein